MTPLEFDTPLAFEDESAGGASADLVVAALAGVFAGVTLSAEVEAMGGM